MVLRRFRLSVDFEIVRMFDDELCGWNMLLKPLKTYKQQNPYTMPKSDDRTNRPNESMCKVMQLKSECRKNAWECSPHCYREWPLFVILFHKLDK